MEKSLSIAAEDSCIYLNYARDYNNAFAKMNEGTTDRICLILSEVAYRNRVKKDADKLFIRFKQNKLKPLITLLKSEQFDLRDSAKVEWLIQSCNDRIRDSEKPLFGETKTFTLVFLGGAGVSTESGILETINTNRNRRKILWMPFCGCNADMVSVCVLHGATFFLKGPSVRSSPGC